MMGLLGLPQPRKERTQYATGSAFWPGLEEFVDFEAVIRPRKPMPPRKIHHQYVVSKEHGKWLIQSELIMDEEHFADGSSE